MALTRSTPLRRSRMKARTTAMRSLPFAGTRTNRLRRKSALAGHPHVIPAHIRRQVIARSGGRCEASEHAAGCAGIAHHLHHRRFRSQGGADAPFNLAHVSWACHEKAHAERAWGLRTGLVIPGYVGLEEEQ